MIDAIYISQLLTTSITATTRTSSQIRMPKVSNSTCRSSHQDGKKRSKHQYRGATKARYKTCFKGIVDYKVILVSHFVGADGNKPPPPTNTVTILMTMKASLPPSQDPWRQLKCKASQRAQTPLQCSPFWDRHTPPLDAQKIYSIQSSPAVVTGPELVEVGPPWKCLQNPYPDPDRNWQILPLSHSTVQVDCSKFCGKLDSFIRIEIRLLRPINSDVHEWATILCVY